MSYLTTSTIKALGLISLVVTTSLIVGQMGILDIPIGNCEETPHPVGWAENIEDIDPIRVNINLSTRPLDGLNVTENWPYGDFFHQYAHSISLSKRDLNRWKMTVSYGEYVKFDRNITRDGEIQPLEMNRTEVDSYMIELRDEVRSINEFSAISRAFSMREYYDSITHPSILVELYANDNYGLGIIYRTSDIIMFTLATEYSYPNQGGSSIYVTPGCQAWEFQIDDYSTVLRSDFLHYTNDLLKSAVVYP